MKAADLKCPYIETMAQAEDLGHALKVACMYDPAWAPRVFGGDTNLNVNTGPAVLNDELQSMWDSYWRPDQRRTLIVEYTKRRLLR